MLRFVIIGLLMFLGPSLLAQSNLDSLYAVWVSSTHKNTERVEAYYKYINEKYSYRYPDSAIAFAEELHKFSKTENLEIGMAYTHMIRGASYFYKANLEDSEIHFLKGLELVRKLGNRLEESRILNNLGNIKADQGSYIESLDYYLKSLEVNNEINYLTGKSNVLHNIGSIYADQDQFQKAIDYYQKSLVISNELDDSLGKAHCMGNIGSMFIELKDYNQAQYYLEESLKYNQEIDDKSGIAHVYYNLANNYLGKNNSDKALYYYQESLKILEEIEDNREMIFCTNAIGKYYLNKADYAKALQYCLQSYQLSNFVGSLLGNKESCECLYNSYKAMNNNKKALEYHELMVVYNDSLQAEDTGKRLQKMEFAKQVVADSIRQEQEKLKLEMAHQIEVRKKDKNKNIAIASGIFFLLLSGGLYSRWRYVKRSKHIIEKEKDRSEQLLLNILPAEVAEELKEKGEAEAQDFEMVSILFSDFKGFTGISEKLSAKDLVNNINECFKAFDAIMQKYNIEKIKTIGDAYMAAGGLPIPEKNSVKNTVLAALEMQDFIIKLHSEKEAKGEHAFKMRVGIHTGPVVAGIVGVKKFQYDVWGDTVNTASRMESTGKENTVNISETTYNYIKNEPEFLFEHRGKVKAKGKGEIDMYFVELKNPKDLQ